MRTPHSNTFACSLPEHTRRRFLRITAAGLAGAWLPWNFPVRGQDQRGWDPALPLIQPSRKLIVQPAFIYRLPVRKEESSWKSWGGVQTAAEVSDEIARIGRELSDLQTQAEFPIEIRPLLEVKSVEDGARVRGSGQDVTMLYACTGSGEMLRSCVNHGADALIFVRHRSGPVYYWYEALSGKCLDTRPSGGVDAPATSFLAHVDDVVVDDYREVLWRLRALNAVKNLKGTRVVALGGVWGKYSAEAPQSAKEKFGFQVQEVAYEELRIRIERANADSGLLKRANKWTDEYLAMAGTSLRTDRAFVVNAFVLYHIFRELMQEHAAAAFTVKSCMGTIIPMSKTTACLSLSLLNDEGWMAFCESDFVIIPPGVLLRHLARKPVFLHNSTFPHQGIVTCAHCTAPRRMNGQRYEPATILTHYESEYGAAPKIEMPLNQQLTFLNPEYTTGRWVGFRGRVQDNPSYAICRSQQDVEIEGNWRRLLPEVRDSHWVTVYGDYLKEAGYAARKLGLSWANITDV